MPRPLRLLVILLTLALVVLAGCQLAWQPPGELPIPCALTIRTWHMPASAVSEVMDAAYQLRLPTHTVIVGGGESPVSPGTSWRPTYGVIDIAWMTPAEAAAANPNFPSLDNNVGFAWSQITNGQRIGGFVVVDSRITDGPYLTQLLMHELGHVVGLDDVSDSSEVMGSSLSTTWGQGDWLALVDLGILSGCAA